MADDGEVSGRERGTVGRGRRGGRAVYIIIYYTQTVAVTKLWWGAEGERNCRGGPVFCISRQIELPGPD